MRETGPDEALELRLAFDREKNHALQSSKERYPEIDLAAIFSNIIKNKGVGNNLLAESCCKLFRALSRDKFQLLPDTLPVLDEMKKAGYPIAVVSDAQKAFCLEEGEMLGLTRIFDFVVMSTDLGFRKPDPRIFMIACTLAGVFPEEAVYIGNDPETDVKGAKATGMKAVLLDRDGRFKNQEPRPDFYAANLWELWQWIKSGAQKSKEGI